MNLHVEPGAKHGYWTCYDIFCFSTFSCFGDPKSKYGKLLQACKSSPLYLPTQLMHAIIACSQSDNVVAITMSLLVMEESY